MRLIHRRRLPSFVAALACAAVLGLPAPASGATLSSRTVEVAESVDRTCFDRELAGGAAGIAKDSVTASAPGLLNATLTAASGDWDLAIFSVASGDPVAASAAAGSDELASGFVLTGEELVVQACRRTGRASRASLDVELLPADAAAGGTVSLVRVRTPTEESVTRLQELGLDLTEHGGEGFVDVVLHGASDATKLAAAGFATETLVADLTRLSAQQREADRAYAARVEASGLPSERTTYRRLFDYSDEMKRLAEENPDLVRHFTLPETTYEGRPVEGIEIGAGRRDGKPVFLQMGLHHAREWPSGEHSIEWAYELIEGYRAGAPRASGLVESTRTVVVPVVNPDGFNISREAGELLGAGDGRGGDATQETINIITSPYEYRRKNCRLANDAESGSCLQPSLGLAEPGVDPNRNYGGFWGGPGASTAFYAQDYRGPGPFSEPETRNVRDLVSRRQVTTLITNHTYSNLVLRPPGIQEQGETPDEPIYKGLGDAMAAENGYASQHGYQLYDTTGTTEDWSYYATGGLGYTFEIGPTNFHPPFEEMVAEYEGTTEAAAGGDGNREAYFLAQENTADASKHSVLAGRAPPGATLRLHKTFETPTYEEQHGTTTDTLDTTLEVPGSGAFEWHVNPSTRPLVAEDSGRPAEGPPSPPEDFAGDPTGAQPCVDFDTEDEACYNDHPFTVPAGPDVDNAKATIRIEWLSPGSDWDMKVYRDANGDGSSAGEGEPLGSSGQGATNFEETALVEPTLAEGESYVVRVINWAAVEPYEGTITYAGPDAFEPAQREAWTLTCERGGQTRSSQQVFIDRGERQRLNLNGACRR